jgi:hypothetical protein
MMTATRDPTDIEAPPTGRPGTGSGAMDEIRDLLFGETQRQQGERLARLEARCAAQEAALAALTQRCEALSRDLHSKLGTLDATPWENLRQAIAAVAYRLSRLEARSGDGGDR